ncbi:unnamed protein product [Dimorphilus gyrociliatus]|uniref:Uncharacterized protein n=1 Tax=Dimorphilus gyrociliatus TaxID=2664684 RepID=A0A7I8VHP4_9ANNE|nr:unnamed protein product [Dimorphilus gyrociliatus]
MLNFDHKWREIAQFIKLTNFEIEKMEESKNPGEELISTLVRMNITVDRLCNWLNEIQLERGADLLAPYRTEKVPEYKFELSDLNLVPSVYKRRVPKEEEINEDIQKFLQL